ncbi:MAG: ATPase, T2SS/T4P/T4SS family [Patescibacteria group bacterium]
MTNEEIKKILIDGNYATPEDITKVEDEMNRADSLSDALIREGIVTSTILGQAIAEFYGVPFADLNSHPPFRESVLKIPEDTARKYRLIAVSEDQDGVTIATDNPKQEDLIKILPTLFKDVKIYLVYSTSEQIDEQFSAYQKSLETRFSKIIKENSRVAPEIIDQIIGDALGLHSSDVHFEPIGEDVVIRFRIDGVMHEAGKFKKLFYENILNRVKVQAKLRIDEHYAAQDGSIRYQKDGHFIDLRVSIVPTVDGEKIVIRILGEYVRGFTLGDLGLSKEDETIIREAADKPFGMILVAGPTGSGKTTTLYALIRLLNSPKVNITTIEDPVEYHLAGINQIQVNPATDLTFAKGLRSIVRQDPDVVLVGEIRDRETAEIAVNAALTGHLLLSTFHANDSATVIPRLLNMGIEPFLLSSTFELIISQRLVRKICMQCRYGVEYTDTKLVEKFKQAKTFFSEKKITLYEGKGCDACNHTGFTGRSAIFEFIKISPGIEDLIIKNPSSGQIWELARKEGAISMFEDGIRKVKNGITTIDELLRVAEPPRDII